MHWCPGYLGSGCQRARSYACVAIRQLRLDRISSYKSIGICTNGGLLVRMRYCFHDHKQHRIGALERAGPQALRRLAHELLSTVGMQSAALAEQSAALVERERVLNEGEQLLKEKDLKIALLN